MILASISRDGPSVCSAEPFRSPMRDAEPRHTNSSNAHDSSRRSRPPRKSAISVERLASIRNELPMPDQVRQFGLSQPIMPSDLRGVGLNRLRDDDLMQTEPIRADHAVAQELEQETRPGMNTKLFHQLPRSSILIRLGHVHRASEHPVDLSRESSVIVWTAVDKEPPCTVAAHDRRYAMQPPVTNRLPPLHDSEYLVTLVNPLNQFTHEAHDGRGNQVTCHQRPSTRPAEPPLGTAPASRSRSAVQ
ncbi:hypothetical protein RKD23_007461 [Streptomyces sp. SAI-170]